MPDSSLCSVRQLTELLEQNQVKVVDGSWYLPNQQRNALQEFQQQRIPGAYFFDIDRISDQNSNLPHMLPSANLFAHEVSKLDITKETPLVIYDTAGLFSAARVWWTFKVFGHEQVKILNGGLPEWMRQGGELAGDDTPLAIHQHEEDTKEYAANSHYQAHYHADLVCDKTDLINNLKNQEFTIIDARPKPRFMGLAPEPRPGLPSGHIPDSLSLSYDRLIHDGQLKPLGELQALFTELGIDQSSEVVTSCGSGVTAAIITLALSECGFGLNRLYDGAWAEWGAAKDTKIVR